MTEGSLISGGGVDPKLSEFGRAEAALIASEILRLSVLFDLPVPSKVIHSPQLRAQETATLIASQLNIQLENDSRLREIEFGEWEGKSMDALQGDVPDGVEAWRGSSSHRPPGGESILDLELRVGSVISEQTAVPGSVALVAHMMPCRAIFRLATGAAVSANWGLNFLPASVSVYRFYGPDFAEVFTVNSTAHLISTRLQG
jgi:probable phosphoglycerate mutase